MSFGGLHNLGLCASRILFQFMVGWTGNDATVTWAAAASTVVTGKLRRRRLWETQIALSATELVHL
jgi:hypothetical protein